VKLLNSDRLSDIRDADTAAGTDLQTCPGAWQQRRDLLAHIDGLEEFHNAQHALILQLSQLLEPVSRGATTLADIVDRLRMAQEIRASVAAALAPYEDAPLPAIRIPCGDESCGKYRNMNGGCDVCGAPCL
jgi:hypothetical protein